MHSAAPSYFLNYIRSTTMVVVRDEQSSAAALADAGDGRGGEVIGSDLLQTGADALRGRGAS